MQYISPLSLLGQTGSTEYTPKNFRLARQRLMAEFELTGNTTIAVNGKELTRNDVLKLMEQLEGSGNLNFDSIVAADPVLLHFLEQHEMQTGLHFTTPEEQLSPEFTEWISPYFAHAFRKATIRIFRTVNVPEFDTLVVNRLLMTERDTWEAWNGVELYVTDLKERFESISNAKYHTATQIATYASYDIICLLCNLPAERFQPLLNDYAFELMQMAIKEFNLKHRDMAFELMGYARSLQVSEEMMESLLDKENEMQGLVKKEKRQHSTSTIWNVLRVIGLIFFVLSKFAACNG